MRKSTFFFFMKILERRCWELLSKYWREVKGVHVSWKPIDNLQDHYWLQITTYRTVSAAYRAHCSQRRLASLRKYQTTAGQQMVSHSHTMYTFSDWYHLFTESNSKPRPENIQIIRRLEFNHKWADSPTEPRIQILQGKFTFDSQFGMDSVSAG